MVFRFVIKGKYIKLMRFIRSKQPNMREISKKTKFAYGQVRAVMLEWENQGIINPVFDNPSGERDYTITLTPKGLTILGYLESIEKTIKEEPKK